MRPLVDALNYLGKPNSTEAKKPALVAVTPKSGSKKSLILAGAAHVVAAGIGDGQYKLTTQFSEDQMLCLGGRAGSDAVVIREAVHMQPCTTADSQIWTLEPQ